MSRMTYAELLFLNRVILTGSSAVLTHGELKTRESVKRKGWLGHGAKGTAYVTPEGLEAING